MSTATKSMAGGANHLAGIHALRGLAALIVFCFHLHYVGLIPLPKSWGLIASRGGLGVELFYVLSAFSLLFANQKNVLTGGTQWIFGYMIKRYFRIAPLFYAMLIVHCFLLLFVFNGALDLQRIIMSVLFIFNFAPKEAEGIVWASWSIGVEMVFYAFLPLVMVAVRSLRSAMVLWFLAVLASYVFRRALEADPGIPPGYAHYAFMSQLGVFFGGILGYWTYVKIASSAELVRRKVWWLVVLLGPALAILLLTDASRFLVIPGRPDTQLWGLAFGFISVLSAISSKRWMAHPIFQHFGERSYSIYLTHPVVIYLTGPLIRQLYDFCYPTLGGYGFAVCALAVLIPTLLISELTYRLIEVKGIGFGKSCLNTLKIGSAEKF
jgi:peptidoglycan/LPS O-acetylase OafA/YrhL